MSVEHTHCDHPKIGDIRSSPLSVGDVMVARPKTMPASATVGDLRQAFANPHVISALLVDGTSFEGIVHRATLADLPSEATSDDAPARDLADSDVVTVRLSTPLPDAVAILDQRKVDFEYDGEMSPDVALEAPIRALYPFCRLTGDANVLLVPGLHSAHIAARLMHHLGGGTTIGPLLIGMEKPVQIMPMDASVSQIVDMACLAAYQAVAG